MKTITKLYTTVKIFRNLSVLFLLLFSLQKGFATDSEGNIFSANFENGWGNWYVDGGTWDIGIPTSGPGSAYLGTQCAATNLLGNYPDVNFTTRLISPVFTIPSADKNPRLSFYHWFSFDGYDYAYVDIKTAGSDTWTTVSTRIYASGSSIWSRMSVDLSDYADSTVEIAFRLYVSSTGTSSSGWYIDNIQLDTGRIVFQNHETFENGIGQWYADNGTWEVGTPTSGPSEAYQGISCAGTRLAGNYSDVNFTTRLISPVFTIPSADKNPRLSFYHWFSFDDYDYAYVDIKTAGSDTWTTISSRISGSAGTSWSKNSISLTDYADSTVQISFYFYVSSTGTSSSG